MGVSGEEEEREGECGFLEVRGRLKTGIQNQICFLIGRFGRFFWRFTKCTRFRLGHGMGMTWRKSIVVWQS
jgi:hypothetical protein